MLLGTVQISGETLSNSEVRDVCESLRSHSIKHLSLRGCRVSDRHFARMMSAMSECNSISQLNLNLGVVCNRERVHNLSQALGKNRSLTGLFLHGSPLGDDGLSRMIDSLAMHPGIVSLDVGDCQLQDRGVSLLCRLLPPDGAKPGLKELTLSANPGVTPLGWANLALAMASNSCLRVLNVDYNRLGDFGASVLAVATAACKTLEVLDMESTGVTDKGAQILLTLVNKYPTKLSSLVVKDNDLHKETAQAIQASIGRTDDDDDDEDDDSSSSDDDDDDSDSETPRRDPKSVKSVNRSPRRIAPPVIGSPTTPTAAERDFGRTAMRLLKRTAAVDGPFALPGRRRDSVTESDSEELSEYSSASSEIEDLFAGQAELIRRTMELGMLKAARDKHVPLIQVPRTRDDNDVTKVYTQCVVDGNGNEQEIPVLKQGVLV